MIYKSLAIIIIAAGLTSLFSSVYAIPTSSELSQYATLSYSNADMLKKLTGAVTQCTSEITDMTFTHWEDCKTIISGFNSMLNQFTTENSASINTLNPYSSLLNKYGIN